MTLYNEIFEQVDMIFKLGNTQRSVIESIAGQIKRTDLHYAYLAARGTSENAGRYAGYLWGTRNGLPVALAAPSMFTFYQSPPSLAGALVVGISQSGQSPDIVSVLEEGRRQRRPTLAITNAVNSPLAEAADFVIDIQAGEEQAVAATKTYSAQLMAIAMLSAALRGETDAWNDLERVPEWIAECLRLDNAVAALAERYRYMSSCVVIGRGYNYSTAFEWSLKLKELTYIVAEPYSTANFQHGPIAIVDQGFPVFAVAPSGQVFDDVFNLLNRLHEKQKAELVVISDRSEALDLSQSPMKMPTCIPEWVTPMVSIVPAQLFAFHLTQAKGYDTESPRAIQKVTETH